jgi:periplasmic divalent cation tolerance protein
MLHPESTQILRVATTVATTEDARRLARGLVEGRLAACVQIDPVAASVYRWQGQLCEEPEVRLTIKTLPSMQGALQAYFATNHPYDVPQFAAVTVECSRGYADWVRSEVGTQR